ncbi:hypothetical protein [Azospirillum himalayense]|uniref:Uncharacterized protein n=1 Tax=Azospirillum himalayense TaxID=654847 RepID=A0ABW0G638_9PROT
MKLPLKLPTTKKLTAVAGFVALVAAAAAVDKFAGTNLLPWVLAFGGG